MNWRPSAGPGAWRARAQLLEVIRGFFKARSVLEVHTPLLAFGTVTDPHIHSIAVPDTVTGTDHGLYLQTSPEFAMKRLLAAGSGPIYQICPAFRDRERGSHHNTEFTLLEWYQPGFSLEDLMDEMDDLLAECLNCEAGKRLSYRQVFYDLIELDPHNAGRPALLRRATALGLVGGGELDDNGILDFLFTHAVQPQLGTGISYIFDYPASQAALSRILKGQPPVARRVEVFSDGLELANGYEELLDAIELRARFEQDLALRAAMGMQQPRVDESLLEALEHGLPECAGFALGIDRLLMRVLGVDTIQQVLSFPDTSMPNQE